MEKEIEIKMSAIKDVIIKYKSECRKNVYKTIKLLKNEYPNQAESIQIEFDKICRDCGVDFFAEIRIDGDDINEYVEQNVRIVE